MTDIILHHYDLSPYSEKIRAMFGYLDLQWQSVITKEMPPRPLLQPLAGGYRRIPVAQIGADIFCDSHTITEQIVKRSGKTELSINQCDTDVKKLVKEAEGDFFFASVLYSSSFKFNKKVFSRLSIIDIAKLMFDRIKMSRKAAIKMVGPQQAGPIVKEFLPRFEAMLTNDFIFGDSPNIADFSVYHCLWFIHELGEKPILNKYPKTLAWIDRIKQFGHGNRIDISGEDALSIARSQQPDPISKANQSHDLLGELVDVAPSDYCLEASTGILRGSTPTTYIISRESKEAGLVHVHFPKEGYSISPSN